VTSFSDHGEHGVDPFLGGGTTAVACWRTGRRFTGGDLNPARPQVLSRPAARRTRLAG
jgi:DNA modification methylase